MVDVIHRTDFFIQIQQIVNGSKDIFLRNVLRNEGMDILLNGFL